MPGRIRQIRELNATDRLLDISTEDRRRLVAMRAAFSLPATELARHTRDPIGDLAAGHYDSLIAAAYDAAGPTTKSRLTVFRERGRRHQPT